MPNQPSVCPDAHYSRLASPTNALSQQKSLKQKRNTVHSLFGIGTPSASTHSPHLPSLPTSAPSTCCTGLTCPALPASSQISVQKSHGDISPVVWDRKGSTEGSKGDLSGSWAGWGCVRCSPVSQDPEGEEDGGGWRVAMAWRGLRSPQYTHP